MHAESEVEDCAACRHCLELSFWRHDENLVGKEVELDGVEEIDGVGLWVVQDFLDLIEPLVEPVVGAIRRVVAVLVLPMSRKAVLCDVVHAAAAYLHLDPLARFAHECRVECLVAIGLFVVHPVAQAVGVWLVNRAGNVVYLKALVRFVHPFRHFENDADGQYVIDLFEGDVLRLHLCPDAVGLFEACLYLIFDARFVEALADWSRELVEDGGQVLPSVLELPFDCLVFLRVFVLEAEVLELFLYLVQAEPVCQRSVDVERLARYLILLSGELAAQGAHVVQSVRYLYQYDSYVLAHREEQLLERLSLHRRFVAEDAARYLGQSIDNLRYLRPEDVGNVLYRVVRILYHIVQERRADTGAAQADVLARNLRHGDGMHDVWLAGKSSDALVRFLCEVERLVDDFGVLAVVGCQVSVNQVLIRFGNHPLVFHLTKVNVLHSIHGLR